jgi:anti-sigma regulatory factor (Ser/Thr protein kinase)
VTPEGLEVVTAFRRLLPARREAVLATLEEAPEFLSGCGLTPRTQNAVELALEELLSNVSKYAYPEGSEGEMEVLIEPGPDGIRLELVDEGRPFDPLTVPPPPPMTLDSVPGGRGLHLVRSLARSMRYRRDGARNVLVVEFTSP